MRRTTLTLGAATLLGCLGCSDMQATKRADAEMQVAVLAARLRQQTTDTASYVRLAPEDVKEIDPWGTRLTVTYTEGGLSESFEVRSAGPDGRKHTADDIIETGTVVNFKGVGRAMREGVEETAGNAPVSANWR